MSEFQPMTIEQITAIAEEKNCDVVIAQADELQFDLDSLQALATFERFLLRLANEYNGIVVSGWKSKSGNNHKTIAHKSFSTMSVQEKIALQAMGGSDEGREFASLHCYWHGSHHPILLFRPKGAQ